MTPAEAKNLTAMLGKLVEVERGDEIGDWPYFILLEVCAEDDTIKMKGADYPDKTAKHSGDCTWYDWRDVREITRV